MKKIWREWVWWLLGLGGIVLLGVVIRSLSLTILPVFADEAIYIRWSQIMGNEPTLRFLPLSDGKQPFFMWVLMFLVSRFSDPLFIGRLLSVASGLGTMIGIFALSFFLFRNKLVALVSVLLYVLSPFAFFFDRMALVDSMLSMFVVWTILFAYLTAKYLRLDYAMITGFFLGGALLTKSPAVFASLLIPLSVVFLPSWKKLFKYLLLLVPTYLIGYGLYNILRLGPNFQLIGMRNQDYIFPISHLWLNPKDPFIFHIKEIFSDWFIKMGPWPLIILAVGGLLVLFKNHKKEIFILVSYFVFPILVQSMYAKVFTVRYILFTLPPIFILSSAMLISKTKWFRLAGFGLVALFVFLSLRFDYLLVTNPEKANLPRSEKSGYLEEWTAGQGIKEISEYLQDQLGNIGNKKIVVGTEGYFGTLPDGLQMYLADAPEITVIGVGLDLNELPLSLVESKEAGNKTYLVINKSRLSGDPDKIGLNLISQYPKVPRPTDVREYSTKGPQEILYLYEVN
jgi:hypothetical protein